MSELYAVVNTFGGVVSGILECMRATVIGPLAFLLTALIGYYLTPAYFYLWVAVFCGLPLAVLGLVMRLRIMSVLTCLNPEAQASFTYLKNLLDLTDGNLGAHLRKLEESGYITITKAFVKNKPQIYVEAMPTGGQAFREHVAALEAILKGNRAEEHTDTSEQKERS